MLPPLLNIKDFIRLDGMQNLVLPNELYVNCLGYVKTPLSTDSSNKIATTEWVRSYVSGGTGTGGGGISSETDPIFSGQIGMYYSKIEADARYLQSFTETDPTVPAWAKASVKPTYTFAELLSKPTTIAGYGITDIPTTLPASDVYAWAKATTKPSYAYSEITGLPTLFSGSYTDLTNKPTLFSGAYSDLTGKPTLFSGAYADLTGKPTIPTNNNELTNGAGYLTSYTETDPIWTAEKVNYYTKTQGDARYLQSYTETDPIWTSEKGNYALKTYVDTSISDLVASAPAALNTLNELALALGSDANFATTVATNIGNRVPYTGATANVDLGTNSITALVGSFANGVLTGNGSNPANLYLKKGNAPFFANTAGYGLIAAVSNSFILESDVDGTNYKYASFNLGSLTNNTQRAYTLPDASGTLALLEVTQTFTGTNTFSGDILATNYYRVQQNSSLDVAPSGYTTFGAINTKLNFGVGVAVSTQKVFQLETSGLTNNTTRVYTLPDATGTIALTSNLSSYVPTSRTITINGTAYNLSEDRAWTITTASTYTLPTASATVLGGIKVGSNLSIDGNGVLSSTDTNTTYANFTRTVAGLVPNPGGATTNRYLREDGTWVVPPDTDTDTNTTYSLSIPAATTKLRLTGSDATTSDITFTAGANVTITRSSASEFTIASSYTDTNTWNANTKTADGYVTAPGAVANKVWKTDASGNPGWRDDADTDTTYVAFTRTAAGLAPASGGTSGTTKYLREDGTWAVPPDTDTDTNTWNANTKTVAGYVAAPGDVANKVWKTDGSGNPGWRDDADTDTNTTYTAGTGLTLTGTSFSVTKTITASETADTIALRNGSGQLVATGFYQASSRSLKTNINPFTKSALDIIRDVTVVSFNYKTDIINKHVGFIAEDTPEELSTRNKNVMDSNNTIGVLLKAVQELEARIKQLESK